MFAHFRKKSAFVGIAIYPDKISLAKLRPIKKKIIVEGLSTLPLPSHQAPFLQQTLKEWVRFYQAEHCFAALALPSSEVIHQRIRIMACLDEIECEAEIAANLSHYLPEINEPVHFDFLPIKQEQQEVEMQLIAIRSEQVALYCHAAQIAGLSIKIVDVADYAIARAVNFMSSPKKMLDLEPGLEKQLRHECGIALEIIGEKFESQQEVSVSPRLTALGLALRGCRDA